MQADTITDLLHGVARPLLLASVTACMHCACDICCLRRRACLLARCRYTPLFHSPRSLVYADVATVPATHRSTVESSVRSQSVGSPALAPLAASTSGLTAPARTATPRPVAADNEPPRLRPALSESLPLPPLARLRSQHALLAMSYRRGAANSFCARGLCTMHR